VDTRPTHRRRTLGAFIAALSIVAAACSESELFPSTDLTIPPEAVTDAALRYDAASGIAILTWSSPSTNGGTRSLERYEIRYTYDHEFDWDLADDVLDPPQPVAGGRLQSYAFARPLRGRTLRAAVRSIDASGNVSDAGNVATLSLPGFRIAGAVHDAFTGGGLAGLRAVYDTGEALHEVATNADGSFVIDGLHEADGTLTIRSSASPAGYFPVQRDFLVWRDSTVSFAMVPFAQSRIAPYLSLLAVFKQAVGYRTGRELLAKWSSYPVDLYIPEYVNGNGIDYHAIAVAAAERWMELTGVPLYRLVDAPPTVGVEMVFRTPEEMGVQIGYADHTTAPDGTPIRSVVNIVNSFGSTVTLRRTMLHELGHCIRLEHLPAGFLMFGGQPLPDDPTDDEIWIVQLLYALPARTDLGVYREVSQ